LNFLSWDRCRNRGVVRVFVGGIGPAHKLPDNLADALGSVPMLRIPWIKALGVGYEPLGVTLECSEVRIFLPPELGLFRITWC
jgi:hypothetical protein